MAQTRRQFLKGLFQAAALVAAAEIGLGNMTAETAQEALALSANSYALPPTGLSWTPCLRSLDPEDEKTLMDLWPAYRHLKERNNNCLKP